MYPFIIIHILNLKDSATITGQRSLKAGGRRFVSSDPSPEPPPPPGVRQRQGGRLLGERPHSGQLSLRGVKLVIIMFDITWNGFGGYNIIFIITSAHIDDYFVMIMLVTVLGYFIILHHH